WRWAIERWRLVHRGYVGTALTRLALVRIENDLEVVGSMRGKVRLPRDSRKIEIEPRQGHRLIHPCAVPGQLVQRNRFEDVAVHEPEAAEADQCRMEERVALDVLG